MSAMTIREAVALALEAVPSDELVASKAGIAALRSNLLAWAHEFARSRGVILEDSDINGELDRIVAELRKR
jgi:hypothetical protein